MKKILSIILALAMILGLGAVSVFADDDILVAPNTIASAYTDIDAGAWYEEAAYYCLENGLMTAYSAGKFAPKADCTRAAISVIANDYSDSEDFDAAVTRQELVTLIYRVAVANGVAPETVEGDELESFSDCNQIREWAKPAMLWAVQSGIINGDEGLIKPTAVTKRSEAAAILYRFANINAYEEEEETVEAAGIIIDEELPEIPTYGCTYKVYNFTKSAVGSASAKLYYTDDENSNGCTFVVAKYPKAMVLRRSLVSLEAYTAYNAKLDGAESWGMFDGEETRYGYYLAKTTENGQLYYKMTCIFETSDNFVNVVWYYAAEEVRLGSTNLAFYLPAGVYTKSEAGDGYYVYESSEPEEFPSFAFGALAGSQLDYDKTVSALQSEDEYGADYEVPFSESLYNLWMLPGNELGLTFYQKAIGAKHIWSEVINNIKFTVGDYEDDDETSVAFMSRIGLYLVYAEFYDVEESYAVKTLVNTLHFTHSEYVQEKIDEFNDKVEEKIEANNAYVQEKIDAYNEAVEERKAEAEAKFAEDFPALKERIDAHNEAVQEIKNNIQERRDAAYEAVAELHDKDAAAVEAINDALDEGWANHDAAIEEACENYKSAAEEFVNNVVDYNHSVAKAIRANISDILANAEAFWSSFADKF